MTALPAPTWVVGAGGLLGKAIVRELTRRRLPILTRSVPWADPEASRQGLSAGIDALLDAARGGPWRIAWCAGAGVTGTPATVLDLEVATFSAFLAELAARGVAPAGSALFLASSAGGVYAGAGQAPFTELDPASSISPYGTAKLAAEDAAREFATTSAAGVMIGRIANLYGPGQNLAKPQGLVSHICRSHISGQPISVYVSLDTVRDYLFVDDCAGMIADALDRLARLSERSPADGRGAAPRVAVTKILASHQGVTIGALLGECRRLFKRAPRVVLGTSPFARLQVRDLRLRSVVWPELDRRSLTPLGVGIQATSADMLRSVQLGQRRSG